MIFIGRIIIVYNIVSEFAEAKEELQNDNTNYNYWSLLLYKYPQAFVKFAHSRCSTTF